MTNTSDKSNLPKPKKTKKQGPLRTEAVVPTLIVFALLYAYFALFFDSNLRSGLQWTLTRVIGAEANIASVQSSFFGGYFHVYGIQLTDKENPDFNTVEIGSIKFQLVWDALLRAKFVIDEASLEDIGIQTKRKSRGYVLPPPPPEEKSSSSAMAELEKGVLDQTEKQFNKNVLGDVAGMLGGDDPNAKMEQIKSELQAEKKIKALQEALKTKDAEWKKRLADLPNQDKLKGYEDRWKRLDFKSKDPGVVLKSVQEADKIIKEVSADIKFVDETSKNLKSDVGNFEKEFKSIDDVIKEDIRDLQSRMKLPGLDPKEFAMGLFGGMFGDKLVSFKKYYELAKAYIPPPTKSKEERQEEKLIPKPRSAGENIRFAITKGYPLMWLKKARISSKSSANGFSGDVEGELKDLTTSPDVIGRPALLTLKGDFPNQNIKGLDTIVTMDFRGEKTLVDLKTKIASYPVDARKLSESNDLKLAINKAQGGLNLQGTLDGKRMVIQSVTEFTDVDYDIAGKDKQVETLMRDILTGIKMVNIQAKAAGEWGKFDLDIRSNLGDELSKGFKTQLNARIEAAKAKIKAMIDEKINGERAKLMAELDKAKGQLTKQVDDKKKEIESTKTQAEKQLKDGQKQGQKEQQKKLEDSLKKSLKGIKF